MLRYFNAGESHGKALVALVDGFPAGVELSAQAIDAELARRQGGFGRGGRQQIEFDHVEILSGIWHGRTIGSPIALLVPNRDHKIEQMEDLVRPRPGHGDLSGSIKYFGPIRCVLERASARETAVRVAAGAVAQQLLAALGIRCFGYVVEVGPKVISPRPGTIQQQRALRDKSQLCTLDPDRDTELTALIQQMQNQGNTLGGVIEVRVEGIPFGLGSHTQWDRKLDGRLAQAVMSVQAIKGVEIGLGFAAARRPGSEVHDPIRYDPALADTPSLGFTRPTNNAGGLEAGMTNGQPIVIRAGNETDQHARPAAGIGEPCHEAVGIGFLRTERRLAVAAASCVVENVVAFEIARAVIDKFGGDSLLEIQARWKLFHQMAREKLGS